ncbi:MAG: hypothetical protein LBR39_03450 [Coriobacteriales bacterium]|jgi:cell division protein FtsL|nr:hypothetical protein [Coriobacteriales bacterium]
MAQAAYAYQQPARRLREVERPAQPRLRVVPKTGQRAAEQARPQKVAKLLLAVTISVVLFITVVAGVRVALSAATLQTMVASEEVSANIDKARAQGLELEVRYSIATNPDRIQQLAAQQGMVADDQVDYLVLAPQGHGDD